MRLQPMDFYASPTYGRRPNLDIFREHLRARFRAAAGAMIVEVGGMRSPGNVDGDGCASVAWAEHAQECGATFVSIDVDQDAVAATTLLNESGLPVLAVRADGVQALKAVRSPIIMLYLDGADDAGQTVAQFLAAATRVAVGGIVAVDDQHVKGPALAEFMRQNDKYRELGGLSHACNQLAWERVA